MAWSTATLTRCVGAAPWACVASARSGVRGAQLGPGRALTAEVLCDSCLAVLAEAEKKLAHTKR